MWLKTAISLAISFLASACAVPAEYPAPIKPTVLMHGDTSFTPTERQYITESANIWRKQTDGLADIQIVWDLDMSDYSSVVKHALDNNIVRLATDDPDVVAQDCEMAEAAGYPEGVCPPALLAFVSPSGGIHHPRHYPVNMYLIPERYENKGHFVSVSIHEMGHVFGMPHSPSPQAVMYPSNNAAKACLKQPDLVSFCTVNVCEGHTMHPCE